MKKKLLILFAKGFPYGVSEPFLEMEYGLYPKYFDKVLIITNIRRGDIATREIHSDIIELISSSIDGSIFKTIISMLWLLFDINFYKELGLLIKKKNLNKNTISDLLPQLAKANSCYRLAKKWIKNHKEYTPVAIYGYWLNYPAYATVKLNKKCFNNKLFTISRAHRFDLYEYRNKRNYILCRDYILGNLKEIASISEDGRDYLMKTYPHLDMNISIRHLGALDVGTIKFVEKGKTLKIVSCARTVPVKRINRLVSSLAVINDIEIEWTHIGGGPLLESIKEMAIRMLPTNVKATFMDTIPNTQIYETYVSNDYHLFINVSESEGVPVSIMEAMSFGMPVIATAVGGTAELVIEGKGGFLLKEQFEDNELVDLINHVYEMDSDTYKAMRVFARSKFENDYDALKNYKEFLDNIESHIKE